MGGTQRGEQQQQHHQFYDHFHNQHNQQQQSKSLGWQGSLATVDEYYRKNNIINSGGDKDAYDYNIAKSTAVVDKEYTDTMWIVWECIPSCCAS